MNGKTVIIGLVQMKMAHSPSANLGKAAQMVEEAAKKGAQIVCLPELFKSEYFCQTQDDGNFKLAEPIPGETTEALTKIAKKNKVVIIAGIFEKRAEGIYNNSAAVIDADGSLLGVYRKMHIPEDPTDYHEKMYFAPGEGFKSFETAYGKIGVLICWDQWFPEAARLTTLKGAKIIFYPTAIGWCPKDSDELKRNQLSAWQAIQRSHAIANGVFVASANRVGVEENIDFWGSSFVSGPFGEEIAAASPSKEEVLVAKCNLGDIEKTRHGWPFLRDRRIDAYKGITSRFVD